MFCTACRAENKDEARFCVSCGQVLGGVVMSGQRPAQPRTGKIFRFGVVAAIVLTAVAGGTIYVLYEREGLSDYWPIEPPGRAWEYAVTEVDADGIVWSGTDRTTVVGEREFEGEKTILFDTKILLQASVFGTTVAKDWTTKVYIAASKGAMNVVGVESAGFIPGIRRGDRRWDNKRKILPVRPVAALPLQVGASWDWSGEETYLKNIVNGKEVQASPRKRSAFYRVAAREQVSVPAGRFDALKIELRWSKDGEPAYTAWRTKGIGLVRETGEKTEWQLKSVTVPSR